MITPGQREKIDCIHAEYAGKQFNTFWQDHFYSSEGKFGYPVCLEVVDVDGTGRSQTYILAWRTSQAACESALEAIDAYLATLDEVQP